MERLAKIGGFALNEDSLQKAIPDILFDLAEYAREHDDDYGLIFYNPETKGVFLCVGDAFGGEDEETGVDYTKEVEKRVKEAGLGAFEAEAECYPDEEKGWIQIEAKKKKKR